jgi:SAM-dependent methyltransferase
MHIDIDQVSSGEGALTLKSFITHQNMIFELLRLGIGVPDDEFNAVYPYNVQRLSRKHWSPVAVAKAASEFLVSYPGEKVLDVGSGVGKFCMVGAANTKGHFTGIEQRKHLVELSQKVAVRYGLRNVEFIHGNITAIDFSVYNAFYFYNSFYENLDSYQRIDDTVWLDDQLYDTYSLHLLEQLSRLHTGTRLATYCTPPNVVPRSFRLVDSLHGGFLNFWEKVF